MDQYVKQGDGGVLRVGAAGVPLDSVVAGFAQGHSAETIQEQYPSLTLEEVYGAISYYLGHRQEVDAYLKRQDTAWNEGQRISEQKPSAVVRRLRALKRAEPAATK
jgi:uncharacterized protein (DUF433 family)